MEVALVTNIIVCCFINFRLSTYLASTKDKLVFTHFTQIYNSGTPNLTNKVTERLKSIDNSLGVYVF